MEGEGQPFVKLLGDVVNPEDVLQMDALQKSM
jgi:hypothetical protein